MQFRLTTAEICSLCRPPCSFTVQCATLPISVTIPLTRSVSLRCCSSHASALSKLHTITRQSNVALAVVFEREALAPTLQAITHFWRSVHSGHIMSLFSVHFCQLVSTTECQSRLIFFHNECLATERKQSVSSYLSKKLVHKCTKRINLHTK